MASITTVPKNTSHRLSPKAWGRLRLTDNWAPFGARPPCQGCVTLGLGESPTVLMLNGDPKACPPPSHHDPQMKEKAQRDSPD